MLAAFYRNPPILLTLTAFMWAMNAMIGQLAVGEIAPFALVLMRWVMVAGFLWPLYGRAVVEHWPTIKARLGAVVFMSVCGFTAFNSFFYVASIHTTGVNIGILQGAMPVMVLIGAVATFGETVSARQALGVVVTLIGVIVVVSKGDPEVLARFAFNYGDLLMFIAAILYSAYTVAIRNRPDVPGEALFAFFAVVAAIVALPLAVWEAATPGYQWPTPTGWGLTVMVAIFPSCLAQLFFLRGVDLIGPARAGVYINLVPIFAAILAVIVLGEVFAFYHALALALVLGGIWLAQRKQEP